MKKYYSPNPFVVSQEVAVALNELTKPVKLGLSINVDSWSEAQICGEYVLIQDRKSNMSANNRRRIISIYETKTK